MSDRGQKKEISSPIRRVFVSLKADLVRGGDGTPLRTVTDTQNSQALADGSLALARPHALLPRDLTARVYSEGGGGAGGGESMLRLFLMRRKAGRRDGGEIAITHVFFFFLTTKQSSRFFPQSSFIVLDRLLKGHLQGLWPLQLGLSSDREGQRSLRRGEPR